LANCDGFEKGKILKALRQHRGLKEVRETNTAAYYRRVSGKKGILLLFGPIFIFSALS